MLLLQVVFILVISSRNVKPENSQSCFIICQRVFFGVLSFRTPPFGVRNLETLLPDCQPRQVGIERIQEDQPVLANTKVKPNGFGASQRKALGFGGKFSFLTLLHNPPHSQSALRATTTYRYLWISHIPSPGRLVLNGFRKINPFLPIPK
jgi:hypothetical protein